MGLFKPGWMSKDENKAMRSLDRVSDDEELYRIATECPHLNVQIRAVSRIRDADRRLDVALTKRLISLNVRRAALEGASEERLCLVAGKAPMCDIRLEAVDRMSDDTFLAKLVLGGAGGNRDDKRVCEAAYEKMEHPPFECSMLMCSRKADENLLHDVEGMTYPADREKLLRVVREKEGEAAGRAVTKLPYEQEREVLRELAMNGKGHARSAAVASLHLPADRDIADSIIAEPKSGRNLKQHAVRLLPEDDPVLNELCCPFCGALGSVFHHGGYDDAVDMYYSAYEFPLDLMGQEILKSYAGYQVRPKNGYLFIALSHKSMTVEQILDMSWSDSSEGGESMMPYWQRGIANKDQEILIDPRKNTLLKVQGDLVLYGNSSTVGMDYNKLGIGRLEDGKLVPLIPCEYNFVEVLSADYVAAGRVIVTKTTQAASLTTNRVSVSNRAAVQIFSVKDGSPVSDRIYGMIRRNRDGTSSAVMYPNIKPADLLHRQSAGEAFSGSGLLDFSGEKNVRLDSDYQKM